MSENDYAIAWTVASRRALTRLPEKVAAAVAELLYGSLAQNPHRAGKPLKLGLEGLRSARRGDYRVIYRIDDHLRQVTVMAIEHRSDVYRPRQFWPSPQRHERAFRPPRMPSAMGAAERCSARLSVC